MYPTIPAWHAVVVGVGILLAAGLIRADEPATRLARDEPEILVQTGGRNGTCDVIRFSPDGKTLFAVGEDKVLHRWAVGADGLTGQDPLHWNTFRERRGSIYALAVSADGSTAAVAGLGKRDGDVGVFDLRTGVLVGALSAGDGNGKYRGHDAVWALAFSPTGDKLAVGDDSGGVWVCPMEKGRPVVAKTQAVVEAEEKVSFGSRVVWVGYLANGRLAYAKRDGGVYEVDKPEPLFRWKMGRVYQVVASADGRWLAARPDGATRDGLSAVEVRSLPNGEVARTIPFSNHNFPNRFGLNANGSRLAIGVSELAGALKAGFTGEPNGRLEVYDLRKDTPDLIAKASVLIDQVAFHPDGKRMATADTLEHGTSLWSLANGKLTRLAQERGKGRPLWAVGMTADGMRVCFKEQMNPSPAGPNDRGAGPWVSFDLTTERRGWVTPVTPVAPKEELNGWTAKLEFDRKDGFVCNAVPPNAGLPQRVPLDPLRDDHPRCFTFLPGAPGGAADAVRLAVGHYWGVSVFELSAGQKPRLVAKLMGHAGYVTSVAPAYDGQGLVTAGRDQAIALWNLAPFPSQAVLGAAFAEKDGKVWVTAVDSGSPADEAGLSVGDELTKLMVGGVRAEIPQAEWLKELQYPQPTRELAFRIRNERFPEGIGTKTFLLHRPFAKFIPLRDGDRDRDWVLYTYRQVYYDCSENARDWIRWLVSKDKAKTPPEVFPITRFAKFLFKPDKVSKVLTDQRLEPATPQLPDLFPPKVEVSLDADRVKEGGHVGVKVRVTPSLRQDGKVNPVARVELWLNGHRRIEAESGEKLSGEAEFTVRFQVKGDMLRNGENTLNAVGIGRDDPMRGCGCGVSEPVIVTAQLPRAKRRLFIITAGIDDYNWDKTGISNLRGAVRDQQAMADAWADVAARGGREAKSLPFKNQEVTKEAILEQLALVKTKATPDDQLVFFLAGHGFAGCKVGKDSIAYLHVREDMGLEFQSSGKPTSTLVPGDTATDFFYLIPRDKNAAWDRPFTNYNWDEMTRCCLRGSELVAALADLPCPTLGLLDACHSQVEFTTNLPQHDLLRGRDGHGFGAVVVSACTFKQEAKEPGGKGGSFTRAVTLALGPKYHNADTNRDDKLSVDEWYGWVQRKTKDISYNEADKHNQDTTISYPPGMDRSKFILATAPPKAGAGK